MYILIEILDQYQAEKFLQWVNKNGIFLINHNTVPIMIYEATEVSKDDTEKRPTSRESGNRPKVGYSKPLPF